MAAITLKNIPENLYKQIKKSAKDNYRSINNEILFHIKLAIERRRINQKSLISRIEKLQSKLKMPELTDDLLAEAKNKGRA
ncbi:Arc family DNA-binding protein [Bacteroidota bacterium]